jgi:hypothetical protein
MIKEFNFISIKEILSRLLRHPLLQDITLEQVIQHTVDFVGKFVLSKLYITKEEVLKVEQYRAKLPCDIISINQIKDNKSGLCLRSMTSTFLNDSEPSFKTQGSILYTSIKEGEVTISYKAIPVDDEGLPMLIDNSIFLQALELYIKKEVFTILFDMGKISPAVLDNTQRQYAWLAKQLQSEFSTPSISEMESIKNSWCTLIQRTNEFNKGFSELGNREMLKI